jgi:hypothetical protein
MEQTSKTTAVLMIVAVGITSAIVTLLLATTVLFEMPIEKERSGDSRRQIENSQIVLP